MLAWEQDHLDRAVADVFGFHALQLGTPQVLGLRANRMGNRWLAVAEARSPAVIMPDHESPPTAGIDIRCDFEALPFDSQSLDLVVLPHTLELAANPHRTLAEVERVLRPEGRVVVTGGNPASLWGLRRRPADSELIGYRRLRDWLRLLGFELEAGRFGCYRPPFDSARWLARFEWTERWGDRWWPVFGAVYALTAVKRVRGMRLVGLARQHRPLAAKSAKASPAVAAHLERVERRRPD